MTTYERPAPDGVPAVAATAHDPYATVRVDPAETVPGTTNVTVTAEDGSERAYTLAWTDGGAQAPVTATAEPRCLAGKVYVAVRVTNEGDAPVDVAVSTPYGDRSFADVAPGKNAYHAFATRSASVDAGTVVVAVDGGAGQEVAHGARTC
ncbi:hypothetical protein [Cellulosimicrobium sp. CUA-896]|uniref:hypothetical protein n=1 Tax=Cellulosimicrobium sp. CUA-896 TaxID=1517881 RepID=UPI00095CD974|nr:hypothetical protein [Cellulosimicrobium sp. CUA-896]OLT53595.1 hypothetical protein BJF88_10540 [Cellulosimicrobium sp. CUA-896]